MFSKQIRLLQSNLYKNYLISHLSTNNNLIICGRYRAVSCISSNTPKKEHASLIHNHKNWSLDFRKYCSTKDKLLDNAKLQEAQEDKEFKHVTAIFPAPRSVLNNLNDKCPQNILSVTFKQSIVTPKGSKSRKKNVQKNDWTCTYSLNWPEKIKFEATCISKRQAGEKAALQALHWLYMNNRIDKKGCPIYDETVISDLKQNLNQPLTIEVKESSVKNIDSIWKEYEQKIKNIYSATFKEAEQRAIHAEGLFKRDSTLEVDDDVLADNECLDEISNINSEYKVPVHPVFGKPVKPATAASVARRARVLQHSFTVYDDQKVALPIDDYCSQFTEAVNTSQVVILVGAAGCGKSTRAPPAILRNSAKCNMIVSEPRRVAAIGLAERVASELGEEVGETVGFQVRLRSKPPRPPTGSILYCTSGVLLRRLQSNPGLVGCTHVIIDEAHERDVNTDVTLLLLKEAMKLNEDLKVVVMSATLDIGVFTKYFDNAPVIEVPGRTFPVSVTHLDEIQKKYKLRLTNTKKNCEKEDGRPQINCTEVVEVIKAIDKSEPEGAILVFLPGWTEIKRVKTLLDESFANSGCHMILPVHSRLSTQDQAKMFSPPPPGIRKIVVSTNIAETSVTLPDIVYVVDTGTHKENRIREGTGIATLDTVWVSQASAKQRAGRAGRVQPGHCYRLYTKEKESEFEPHITPEILRVPLEQTVLELKTFVPDGKIQDFLAQLPEPPKDKSIQYAVNDLIDLGAFSPTEKLTSLGSYLSSFSLPPRLSLSLLHSRVCGNLPAVGDALPALGGLGGFDMGGDSAAHRAFKQQYSTTSDHAAIHWILHDFQQHTREKGRQGADEWCQANNLRAERLGYMRALSSLYLEQLLKSPVVEPTVTIEDLNQLSDIDELTPATLLSGCNSLLVTRKTVKKSGKLNTAVELYTTKGERAHIGSEGINYGITKRCKKTQLLVYYGGYHSTDRRALVVHMTSLIPPHTALIFSKGDIYTETTGEDNEMSMVTLPRHKLTVFMPTIQAQTILKAREMFWKTIDFYIERNLKTINYEDNECVSNFKSRLIKGLARILVEAEETTEKVNQKLCDNR